MEVNPYFVGAALIILILGTCLTKFLKNIRQFSCCKMTLLTRTPRPTETNTQTQAQNAAMSYLENQLQVPTQQSEDNNV